MLKSLKNSRTSNEGLKGRAEFRALEQHHTETASLHMRDLFEKDPGRFDRFHIKQDGILFDYSKHRITEKTVKLLMDLARACDIEAWREKLFSGQAVNSTENRPALHTALRESADKGLSVDGENVADFVEDTLKQIKTFSDKIRKEKKFTDVVNLGIGGSDLGAKVVCDALGSFADGPQMHFVANVDDAALDPLLKKLQPEKTLFIVVSKSFTTLETLANAKKAKTWIAYHLDDEALLNHFAAITENTNEAIKFGVTREYILPMRKWTGGRTSIWGAAGLPVALSVGFDNFQKFLNGAKTMDFHFCTAPLDKNIPVMMALLGAWYRNFYDFRAHAVIPYMQNLQNFAGWLQQLDMESNGKSVTRDGAKLDYATAPVIFGDPGTNAQHAFFQALHQGTDIIPCDFILSGDGNADLNANALAQAKGFMEGAVNKAEPHRDYPGNRPSSTIVLDTMDPYHLGMLLALYEHKTFAQGVIWNINSFDQWGVELGKILSKEITQMLENPDKRGTFDSSTTGLLNHLKGLVS